MARWLLPLVLAGLVLFTLMLATQAYLATRYQQAVAEEVLRDYAELVTLVVEQRLRGGVGFQLYRLRESLDFGAGPPTVDPQGPGLASFVLPPGSTAVSWSADAGAELRAREAAVLAAARLEVSDGFLIVHLPAGPSLWLDAADDSGQRSGVVIDRAALDAMVQLQLERDALLPVSLVAAEHSALAVGVRITDAEGDLVAATGPGEVSALGASRALGADYGGLFAGFRVQAWVDPRFAHHLVIGGLPSSRLPFLLGLAGLTLTLLLIAVLQVRGERRLARLREGFVAQVSHELRTPLTQIRMFTETLLLGRVRDEAQRTAALEIVERESRRLSHLVENVLQFSRSQREGMELHPAATAVVPLVREVVESFRPLLKDQRLALETRVPEAAEAVVDGDALRQSLLNLLDNAQRYGPADQLIRVVVIGDHPISVHVCDQGPGIPSAEGERVFAAYHRLAREEARAIAGTGIGLAVVRDLMRRMGGDARVAEAGAEGACVELVLPAPSGA